MTCSPRLNLQSRELILSLFFILVRLSQDSFRLDHLHKLSRIWSPFLHSFLPGLSWPHPLLPLPCTKSGSLKLLLTRPRSGLLHAYVSSHRIACVLLTYLLDQSRGGFPMRHRLSTGLPDSPCCGLQLRPAKRSRCDGQLGQNAPKQRSYDQSRTDLCAATPQCSR